MPTHAHCRAPGRGGAQRRPAPRRGGKQRKQALEQRRQGAQSSWRFAHNFIPAAATPAFGILLVFDDRTPTKRQLLGNPALVMNEPMVWLPTYKYVCTAERYTYKPKNQQPRPTRYWTLRPVNLNDYELSRLLVFACISPSNAKVST
jgi:hypothetical protein